MEPTPIFCNISLFFEIHRFMERAISKEKIYASDKNKLCSYIMFDKISARNVFLAIKGM